MMIQRPFFCNSPSTACTISKRLFSYHPHLNSLISPRSTSNNNLFIFTSPVITRFSLLRLHSSPKFVQSIIPYHTANKPPLTTLHQKLPFKTLPQYRNLIIHSGSGDTLDDDSDDEEEKKKPPKPQPGNVATKYKPLFDPFNKKPVIQEPDDPTDLQEIFHKMKEDGLIQNAVAMFDGLSKDGLTHEAMKLFGEMKDKGTVPEVVAHTAVVEAYSKAGKPKDAVRVFMRMQASGVKPNAYSYAVLIQGLCKGGMHDDAGKYAVEMLGYGWRPNVTTYVMLVDAFCKAQKSDEARTLLGRMKEKGFVPNEKATRQHMNKQGRFNRPVMDVLFGKK
eukprot:Gb_26477 [translate_table: standard]